MNPLWSAPWTGNVQGGDGCTIADLSIYAYARQLLVELDGSPVVLKPCYIDGKAHVYCTGYEGPMLKEWATDENAGIRMALAVALAKRAEGEAREIDEDPRHPARGTVDR